MDVLRFFGWSPRTILDIGGYKGTWTRDMQRVFPTAAFTILEPNPHPELRTARARVLYEVVSDTRTEVPWYSNLSTGDSLYKETTRHYAGVTPTLRTTTTLDALFPTETFDFIKLDVQGAELDVLRGGSRVVQSTEVLLLECPFAGVYNANAPTFAETIRVLDELGFAPLEIPELHRANGILCQIDILFLRKTSAYWTQIQARLAA
jgi:FkbM family methyltransferase